MHPQESHNWLLQPISELIKSSKTQSGYKGLRGYESDRFELGISLSPSHLRQHLVLVVENDDVDTGAHADAAGLVLERWERVCAHLVGRFGHRVSLQHGHVKINN